MLQFSFVHLLGLPKQREILKYVAPIALLFSSNFVIFFFMNLDAKTFEVRVLNIDIGLSSMVLFSIMKFVSFYNMIFVSDLSDCMVKTPIFSYSSVVQ